MLCELGQRKIAGWQSLVGTSLNLTQDAIVLQTDGSLEQGSAVRVSFCLPRRNVTIEAAGVVARVDQKRRVAVRFTEISAKNRKRIADFIARQADRAIPKVERQANASRVTPRTAILSVVLFLAAALWTSLAVFSGQAEHSEPAQATADWSQKLRSTNAYRNFTAATDRAAVVAALGPPERESTDDDGAFLVLLYRSYDLYVILEPTGATYTYLGTVRMSDEAILHEPPEF